VDVLYGRNSVFEALRAGRAIRRLLIADGAHGLDNLVAEARRLHVLYEIFDRRELDRRAGDHHQGVIAEAEPLIYAHPDDLLTAADARGEPPLLLALDSLQDPQNFGTLLRTAQAVGAHGVLLPEHRAVGVTPAVSIASAGAVEHLRVARVTNLARSLGQLKSRGVWVYGLSGEAENSYWEVDLSGPLALVVGSEGSGLGRLVREACDLLVRIPMADGAMQSLNASVAGSLVLYEALRRRTSS
jgi:23S rRNA (guanosine2251-2'-O)-methyltransferase